MSAGEPVRRPTRTSKTSQQAQASSGAPASIPDPFYGHEETARLCARFISELFSCPDYPVPPPGVVPPAQPPPPAPPLANFIAYALHRTRLHSCVTFTALFLLQRLKTRFPAARGSSGHRLFISAFMIASKVVCDDTYSNKSWCVVGQGMFSLKEINQMEREMCSYLEWKLNFQPAELADFEAKVRREHSRSRPTVAPINTNTLSQQPPMHHHHQQQQVKPSYPSPPASPATPASTTSSTVSPRSAHLATPASSHGHGADDASSVASSRVSSTFSTHSTSTLATSMASSSISTGSGSHHSTHASHPSQAASKSSEPGFAFASRSVW